MLGLALMILAFASVQAWRLYQTFAVYDAVALDYRSWVHIGERVLSGGGFYSAEQLAGPYAMSTEWVRYPTSVPTLYPPPFVVVFVALTAVPSFLWWAVPLGIIAYLVASWRPAPWSWPFLALALCWPNSPSVVIVGGTSMWVAALLASGLRWHWPALFILLKPTLAPLALVGIRHRSWWVAAIGLGVVSVALLPMWFDYLTVLRNASDSNPLRSLGDLAVFAAVLLAWGTRRGKTAGPG
jgi:hypothetical protein